MAGPYRILVSETGEFTPYTGYVPADYLTDRSFEKSDNFAEMSVPRVVESSIPFPDMDWTSYRPIGKGPWGRLRFYWNSEEDELAARAFHYAVPRKPEPEPEPEPGNFWTNFRACKELFNGTTTPNATSVASIPYSAPLGNIPPATMLWFDVAVGPLGGTAGGGFAYAAGDGSLAHTGGVFKIEAA